MQNLGFSLEIPDNWVEFSLDHMPSSRLFIHLVGCSFLATRAVFALGDPAYAPVILNASGAPVSFVASFTDGRSSSGSLPAGSDAWQRIKGRHLVSLQVVRAGQKHTYSFAQLDELRRNHPVLEELWVIGERGLTLDDRRDINTVRKRVARTHQ
jgi:hypothetical protein